MRIADRVQRLLREGAAAQAAGDGQQLAGVRDKLWEVERELSGEVTAGDLEATACLIDVARPGIMLELVRFQNSATSPELVFRRLARIR